MIVVQDGGGSVSNGGEKKSGDGEDSIHHLHSAEISYI